MLRCMQCWGHLRPAPPSPPGPGQLRCRAAQSRKCSTAWSSWRTLLQACQSKSLGLHTLLCSMHLQPAVPISQPAVLQGCPEQEALDCLEQLKEQDESLPDNPQQRHDAFKKLAAQLDKTIARTEREIGRSLGEVEVRLGRVKAWAAGGCRC